MGPFGKTSSDIGNCRKTRNNRKRYKQCRENIKRKIDCKVIEKRIQQYLDNELSPYEMQVFLDHVKECPDCKEELTIRYMISEGLTKAEENNEYDLLHGLEEKMKSSYKKIRNYDIGVFLVSFMILATLGFVILAIIFAIL